MLRSRPRSPGGYLIVSRHMMNENRQRDSQACLHYGGRKASPLRKLVDDASSFETAFHVRRGCWLGLTARPLLNHPASTVLLKRLKQTTEPTGRFLHLFQQPSSNSGVVRVTRSSSHLFGEIEKSHQVTSCMARMP